MLTWPDAWPRHGMHAGHWSAGEIWLGRRRIEAPGRPLPDGGQSLKVHQLDHDDVTQAGA